jgi:hypothetical protein
MWWYRSRRGFYGRRRRFLFFPLIFFFIAMSTYHFWSLLLAGLILFAMVALIVKAISATNVSAGNMNIPPGGQVPYQQPGQTYQYYQPPQAAYQPYEQGYQPTQAAGSDSEQGYQYQPKPEYDEQPQVQYPQELPPMQQ